MKALALNSAPALAAHNAFHWQCVASAREAALWAALAGLELMEQKHTLPHGAWMPFVAQYCEFSHSTANNYLGAAQRAIEALGEFGTAPSQADEHGLGIIKARLLDMLACDRLDERRAALIAAVCQPVTRPARAPKPKRTRAPRPTGPRPLTMQSLPPLLARIRITAPEVLQALADALPAKNPAQFSRS